MRLDPATGFIVVDANETITITVTATNIAYTAAFPPAPSCTSWSAIQGPANSKESRAFVAPATSGTQCFAVITFDFQSDAPGAFPPGGKYDIHVAGSNGGTFDDFPVTPPPVQNRQYKFQVA